MYTKKLLRHLVKIGVLVFGTFYCVIVLFLFSGMGPTSLAKSPSPKLQSPPPSPTRLPQSPDNPSPSAPIREVCISRFNLALFFGEINKTFYLIEKPEKYTSNLKAQFVPVTATNIYRGNEGIALLLLNLRTYKNVSGQLHALAATPPQQESWCH